MGYSMNYQGRVLYLPLPLVKPGQLDRGRPTAQLQELAASIGEMGILQPLTVRKTGESYTVVSGNRRLLAARMAGLGEVPCILLEAEALDAELISLTENLQREDLHYFEEAQCLQQYLTHSGLTQAQLARRLGRSQSAIANKLRLLQHSPRVQQSLKEQGLSERHARELLRIPGETGRLLVLSVLAERGLNVVQTQRYIDSYLENRSCHGEERCRRRDTRLFLERVVRDMEALQAAGVDAELRRQDSPEEIVLTLRIVHT
jgi:ParB family chromosome partitioning protein